MTGHSLGEGSVFVGVRVRDVVGLDEMKACEALYGDVMRLRPEDGSINPRLLIALQHNSGHVVGAFRDDRLMGFAYSFLARDQGEPVPALYQYSQLTVVATDHQGRGIGRRLKYAQRDRCRAAGIDHIRWAFDPLRTRNAHFNLDVLGASVIQIVPAMYGARGFGADCDDETDRFIASWCVHDRPCPTLTNQLGLPDRDWPPGVVVPDGDDLLIPVPASWERYRSVVDRAAAASTRAALRAAFTAALESGRVGLSCRIASPDVAVYRFGSWPHPEAPR